MRGTLKLFAVVELNPLAKSRRLQGEVSGLLPDNVGVGELLQQADLSYYAVLVHIVFVDLHHHHLPTTVVNHLKGSGVC